MRSAATLQRVGPDQLEAAIQSAHINGRLKGELSAHDIALLYQGLVELAPTLGAGVAHAIAIARAEGPARGLAAEAYQRAIGLTEDDGARRFLLAKSQGLRALR